MKLIIGLGNPGEKYSLTRHNIGFIFLDKLRSYWSFPDFKIEQKFNSQLSQGNIHNQKVILAKPETFMNLSGEATRQIATFLKVKPVDIILIHDDKDIELGKYKISTNSSSAGHNGVQNVIDQIGTQEFIRLRIGIKPATELENNQPQIPVSDFVLGKIDTTELEKIMTQEQAILKELDLLVQKI